MNEVQDQWQAERIIDTTKSGVHYIRYRKARNIMNKGGICSCEDGTFDYYAVLAGQIIGYNADKDSAASIIKGAELARIRSSHKWHWKAD